MASTYLERTLGTPTSQRIFTISAWIKISKLSLSDGNYIIGQNSTNESYLRIDSSNRLMFADRDSGTGGSDFALTSNALLRDVSAWYHVILSVDTTQATDTNRGKLYINGVLQTLSASTYPPQNYDTMMNLSGATQRVGRVFDYFDGSMSHVHFIDGTAYDASYFGETDATTGIWKPKTAPSVTYGTNGFFLKGENSGSLGTDSSGNANNFTVNGTPTQTIDTPSNVFCTMNPLYKWDYNLAITNGNTSVNGTQSQWQGSCGTLGITKGKYYFEYKFTSATDINNYYVGFMSLDNYKTSEPFRNGIHYYNFDGGEVFASNTSTFTNTTADYGTGVNGDIFGIALDYDNSLFSVYKNGTALVTNHDFSASVSTAKGGNTVTPVIGHFGTGSVAFNFGNGFFGTTAVASATADESGLGIFEYDVPTGYYALCTKNINAQEYS